MIGTRRDALTMAMTSQRIVFAEPSDEESIDTRSFDARAFPIIVLAEMRARCPWADVSRESFAHPPDRFPPCVLSRMR